MHSVEASDDSVAGHHNWDDFSQLDVESTTILAELIDLGKPNGYTPTSRKNRSTRSLFSIDNERRARERRLKNRVSVMRCYYRDKSRLSELRTLVKELEVRHQKLVRAVKARKEDPDDLFQRYRALQKEAEGLLTQRRHLQHALTTTRPRACGGAIAIIDIP